MTPRTIGMAGLATVCSISCTPPEDQMDKPLARAYDQVLNWSDLRQVVPLGSSAEDSTILAQRYIDTWLRQQVILQMAERNLSTEGFELEDQLEEYRRSLVIFNYEQALVDQKLDTAVSDQEIRAYYEAHRANFELKDNIVRARWFKVNEPDKRVVRKMEERFLGGKNDQLHDLELWLAGLGVSITDRSGAWTPYSEVLAEVPLSGAEAANLLARGGKLVVKQDHAVWFVEILDHRTATSASPLEMVQQDIRSILLNQRKLQLIESMRETVYKQALEHEDVELYK